MLIDSGDSLQIKTLKIEVPNVIGEIKESRIKIQPQNLKIKS